MRGLFFCQHLWGVGHLMRGARLCQTLSEEMEIDFVQGGEKAPLPFAISSPLFHHHYLSPLSAVEEAPPVETYTQHVGNMMTTALERRHQIEAFTSTYYDFFITESFPFGKSFLMNELFFLAQALLKVNPRMLLISSYKGVNHDSLSKFPVEMREKAHRFHTGVVTLIDRYYDAVLVHTDPSFIKVEETMPEIELVKDKLHYTGFISDNTPLEKGVERQKEILISTGSGALGEELIKSVVEVACHFPDYQFLFIEGPYLKETTKSAIVKKGGNCRLVPFMSSFTRGLQKVSLFIGLAGSTLIDLYRTKTPSLILPSERSQDQAFLARKFEEKGGLQVLRGDELEKAALQMAIGKALSSSYPSNVPPIECDGALHSAMMIKKMVRARQ